MSIDRKALVGRHRIVLTAPDATAALSVGNGDFAFTADISGLQSFPDFHDPASAVGRALSSDGDPLSAAFRAEPVLNTTTQSTWGWHEMPNPEGFVLDDAMSEYETSRGPVRYPDRFDMVPPVPGAVVERPDRAGAWLHVNPQRLDLGRLGLRLRSAPDADAETSPAVLVDPHQELDLWDGMIESRFGYAGETVVVQTAAAAEDAVVATRVESALLADGRAAVTLRFPYASDDFFRTSDWEKAHAHTSVLRYAEGEVAYIDRKLDDTHYVATVRSNGVVSASKDPHEFTITTDSEVLDVVVVFSSGPLSTTPPSLSEVFASSAQGWLDYWESGAAVDFAGSTDDRAQELERRVVISQYLTRVHSAGRIPPQETGLLTNSWQGKFHLEMHYWHAAHFALWGRPHLLTRSFDWYLSILDVARETAERQGYPGARWPKQVGPDGRESPTPIGALLIWQQPHILHLLELAWQASDDATRSELVRKYARMADETAAFMAAFPDSRRDGLHLGPPVMPAQEFYDARTTSDPTFELAYWWFGLEIAQRWRERRGLDRDAGWARVQQRLVSPRIVDGRYRAVATSDELRRDDHPSLLAALGVVPHTPLIDPGVMEATLLDVVDDWDWNTAWGWDFPVLAMTAARLGRPHLAIDLLLRPEAKNRYTRVGHNPQAGAFLPLYLPGNGGLLNAVALFASGAEDGTKPIFPLDGWNVEAERFPARP